MFKQYRVDEWLHDLETRNAQEILLGLTRVMHVAQKLQLHRPGCRVITVAGTNGKGSTAAALECVYHVAGYRVGVYTSPHLLEFNERIRVNLIPIADEDLCQAFTFIEEAREDTVLSYFEMTTLAALWYFKTKPLDIIILEVGLGGRLDATNIVDADVAIITTVDFDHQDYLGTTLDAIGFEKAGIMRQGKPLIYADTNPPASVMDAARHHAAPVFLLGQEFSIQEDECFWGIDYARNQELTCLTKLPKPLIQLKSAAAALTACLLLSYDLPVTQTHFHMALQRIFIPGRLELHQGRVSILYDVSHNPQAVKLLAERLQQIKKEKTLVCGETGAKQQKVHAVFSALKNKDIFNLIVPLRDCVDCWYPAQLKVKRAARMDAVLKLFRDAEICVDFCYNNPLDAFEAALKHAEAGDLIVVYGSFFTVSYVKRFGRFNEINNR